MTRVNTESRPSSSQHTGRATGLVEDLDRQRAGQGEHEDLELARRDGTPAAWRDPQDLQPAEGPPGVLGREEHNRSGLLPCHFWSGLPGSMQSSSPDFLGGAASTAAAAATARGDVAVGRVQQSAARPRDRAPPGSASDRPHDSRSLAGSGPGTPPSTTHGRVVAPKTASGSSHEGIFNQVCALVAPSPTRPSRRERARPCRAAGSACRPAPADRAAVRPSPSGRARRAR